MASDWLLRVASALVMVNVGGGKAHTVEDTTISWLHPVTEGLYLASLEDNIVRACKSGAKSRRGQTKLISVG